MIAGLEARLAQDPNNAEGWRMLGWSYFETGDLMRSASAYRRAAEIEPDKADNWSSLGEPLQTASTSVPPDAEAAFQRAPKLDPADARTRPFPATQKAHRAPHEATIGHPP